MDFLFQILQLLLSPFSKLLKYLWTKARVWQLQRSLQQAPISEDVARTIVQAVVTGEVSTLKVYKNIDSPRLHITALVRPNDKLSPAVTILEQIGGSYRALWRSEDTVLDSITSLEVTDVDRDGYHEVVITSESYGTGARSRSVTAYFHSLNQAYQLTEDIEHQRLSGPIVPEVSFDPEPPEAIRKTLESIAVQRGLLQTIPQVDWESPEYAVPRWHRDNGSRPNGKLKLTFYSEPLPREPLPSEIVKAPDALFWSTIVTSHDDGQVVWIAYFKNPLVGYLKAEHRWFVAYSPANMYAWVTSLAHDGRRIWFTTHMDEGLWSFDFTVSELLYHTTIGSIALKVQSDLRFENGRLYFGDGNSASPQELNDACARHVRVPL